MTQLQTANIGSYPRIGEEKDQQRHRRALQHRQNKEISAHAFNDVEQSVIQEIVREQLLTDLDQVTDGLVSWHDPISHFCRKLSGVRITGLHRFLDTNTCYRIPLLIGRPRKKASHVLPDYIFAQSIASRPIRPILTGPYTLARHTQGQSSPYTKVETRLKSFSDIIKAEIVSLVAQGAKMVQIDEPSIPHHPEDINMIRKTLEVLSEAAKPAQLVLNISFSPLASMYDQIRSLPVDVLNLDFTMDGPQLFEKMINNPPSQIVGFGLVDARSTKMESIDDVSKILKIWAEKINPEVFFLTPSSGLDQLPRNYAFDKLKIIQKVKLEMMGYKPSATANA